VSWPLADTSFLVIIASNALQCLESGYVDPKPPRYCSLTFFDSRSPYGVQLGCGMGQEGRPSELVEVCLSLSIRSVLFSDAASPGYVLTKLTKTILAHDLDLKVCGTPFFSFLS